MSLRGGKSVTQAFCHGTQAKERSSHRLMKLPNSHTIVLLLTNFLFLRLPVLLLFQLRIHSQAVSVYAVRCSENANTFFIMNIWAAPVEKSSDSIPSMSLAMPAGKQAADGIRKHGSRKERMCA